MWNVTVPVVGRCRACGEDLEIALRVRATPEWIARYEYEDQHRRQINRALVRYAIARHERRCPARARPLMSHSRPG
jgi:hypothetical protein